MKYSVISLPAFEKQFSKLAKKYPSLVGEMGTLINSLEFNPLQGKSLGQGLYKIRVAIASKGQGKSGGARVITCVKVVESNVILAAVYDKSTQETMTERDLAKLLEQIP